jgi:4a-hydroxytetrahydrobiopterin dehydratase
MAKPLAIDEIEAAIAVLPGWRYSGDALEKTYQFADFGEAMGFIVRLGIEAEKRDHHPHLTNVYNRVELRLQTHSAGNAVTEKDLDLARAAERILVR